MNRFVLCHPVSSAGFWVYIGLLVVGVTLLVVFMIRVLRSRDAGGDGSLTVDLKTRVARLRGPTLYLVLGIGALGLALAYSTIDHAFGFDLTPRSQRVDLKVGESLGVLRDKFEGYSARGIVLGPGVEVIRVEGAYEGSCVADLFYAVCLRHQEMLACEWPSSDPVMYINRKEQ